jgi:uncharacterized protein YcnI
VLRIVWRLLRTTLLAIFAAMFAVPAGAHVEILPASAAHGATVDLAFRVPNERPRASTVRLIVQFPAIAHIAVAHMPAGWHAHVTMRRLAAPLRTAQGEVHAVVDTIEWTGGRLTANGIALFHVRVGPLPRTGNFLTFKVNQTYSNGEIVRWIETQFPGQAEPQRPAPVLRLVAR